MGGKMSSTHIVDTGKHMLDLSVFKMWIKITQTLEYASDG